MSSPRRRERSISPVGRRRSISPVRGLNMNVIPNKTTTGRMERRTSISMNLSTFRQNLSGSMIPDESSIQCQSVFCEHYFNDGHQNQKKVLYNSYSTMEENDPITGEKEQFILTSLNSIFDGLNHREPLNLILVLDISGSMSSGLDGDTTKMQIANETIVEIIKSMKKGEYFGIILFDNKVEIFSKMTKIDDSFDIKNLEKDILAIKPRGSTNMEIGMSTALDMMKKHLKDSKKNENQNRIIFLTDACPNQGEDKKLIDLTQEASKLSIFTTYIGIGLDFDTGFVNELTRTQGTNYFGISSKKEFQDILNTNFNYIVTPISFNTKLLLESEYYCIDAVYGTAFEEEFKNDTIDLASQIASPKDEKLGKKGNMLLIKIKQKLTTKKDASRKIKMTLFYDTILREQIIQSDEISFDSKGNEAIEKAIAFMKYVKLSHKVMKDEVKEDDFKSFIDYLNNKTDSLKDETIKNEIDLLVKLNDLVKKNKQDIEEFDHIADHSDDDFDY
eukprot:gene5988-9987_t